MCQCYDFQRKIKGEPLDFYVKIYIFKCKSNGGPLAGTLETLETRETRETRETPETWETREPHETRETQETPWKIMKLWKV